MTRFGQGFLAVYALAGVYFGVLAYSTDTPQDLKRIAVIAAAWPVLVSPTFAQRELCPGRR